MGYVEVLPANRVDHFGKVGWVGSLPGDQISVYECRGWGHWAETIFIHVTASMAV